MIIVYTGNGKGKTTAALGLALRVVGWGKRVLMIQFLKKQTTGELKFASQFQISNLKFQIKQYGTKDFVDPKHLKQIDDEEAEKALESSRLQVKSSHYDLIILDEINVAVKFGLIKIEDVLGLINRAREKGIDLVLTGRWADLKLVEGADLVTEFKEIKHPFKKGIKAKMGIDY